MRSCATESATGRDCGEVSFESQGGQTKLYPWYSTCFCQRKNGGKYYVKSHESYQVYKVCSNSEKGAWSEVWETAHKTLATAHLGFLATSAAEIVANLAALGFLSDSARSNKVDTLTFLVQQCWPTTISTETACDGWPTVFSTSTSNIQSDIAATFFFSFSFCHIWWGVKKKKVCVWVHAYVCER